MGIILPGPGKHKQAALEKCGKMRKWGLNKQRRFGELTSKAPQICCRLSYRSSRK